MPDNLYVHFPFCRTKCSYCALYSRAGVSQSDRDAYVRRLAQEIKRTGDARRETLKTIYFGGGSPALCDLRPIFDVLARSGVVSASQSETEFTVELHPLDVTDDLLKTLRDGGVNRVSMGVQSLDDATLADMGRGYTVDEAERAFVRVKRFFDNAGIDLIVGYPGDEVKVEGVGVGVGDRWNFKRLESWGLKHCSVYSLQNERGLKGVPDDDAVLDRLRHIAICLQAMGLERYEISNYAVPGYECRHNFAVWRGEDYLGLGEGACGRIGLRRTSNLKAQISETEVTPEEDLKERTIFLLRTRDGLDASSFSSLPSFQSLVSALDHNVETGLLTKAGTVYRLTDRGMEVCDSILAELV